VQRPLPTRRRRRERGLTLRSRRGPTAKHRARLPALSIIRPAGPALRRRPRLTSNVRPTENTSSARRRARTNTTKCAPLSCSSTTPGPSSELESAKRIGQLKRRPAYRGGNRQSSIDERTRQKERVSRRRRVQSAEPEAGKEDSPALLEQARVLSRSSSPKTNRLVAHLRPRPNTSVEARPNGGPPGPGWRYAVHFRHPGPGVPPLAPPHLER